tara:strand:+ start:502 stop:837 length:336 start_codon:yes stop_codon:yes gene_type:complete
MMKSTLVILALVTGGLVVGCTAKDDRILFDGKYFRTKVSKVDKQRDVIAVTVRDPARSIDGAREAGRHAGVSYCVKNYGNSDIDWVVGPDTPPEQLRITDNKLIFQGTCPQ